METHSSGPGRSVGCAYVFQFPIAYQPFSIILRPCFGSLSDLVLLVVHSDSDALPGATDGDRAPSSDHHHHHLRLINGLIGSFLAFYSAIGL